MISVETYILFVAPFVMGAAGVLIYWVGTRAAEQARDHTPAE
jgi:hypothetical protein